MEAVTGKTENIWLPGHIDNLERTFGDDMSTEEANRGGRLETATSRSNIIYKPLFLPPNYGSDQICYIWGNMHEVSLNYYAVSPVPAENYEEYYALSEKSIRNRYLAKTRYYVRH